MFPTSQARRVGNFALPAPGVLWDWSEVSDDEDLRGGRLYEALLLLKPAGLAETAWADKAGVNRGFFSDLKNSDISPRGTTLRKVLAAVGRTEGELRQVAAAGRAPVYPDRPPMRGASDGDGGITIRQIDLSYAMGDGANLEDYPEEQGVVFDPNFLRLVTRAAPERLFVARGDGDSMQPTLINGDTLLIDTSQRRLNMQDRVWACAYQGAGMVKRLRVIGEGRVEIRSDNPVIGNLEVDADDLHIVGRVVWVGRQV